jgi:hypothetical protein
VAEHGHVAERAAAPAVVQGEDAVRDRADLRGFGRRGAEHGGGDRRWGSGLAVGLPVREPGARVIAFATDENTSRRAGTDR